MKFTTLATALLFALAAQAQDESATGTDAQTYVVLLSSTYASRKLTVPSVFPSGLPTELSSALSGASSVIESATSAVGGLPSGVSSALSSVSSAISGVGGLPTSGASGPSGTTTRPTSSGAKPSGTTGAGNNAASGLRPENMAIGLGAGIFAAAFL
ncbi:hypothetical protein AAF712_006674 [Marasmius tenuissimus]|uniref:Uncharacterized protein n=1 Tax=Marasmius tenuissimus TaxID=585030 RepID=A0ABR2ZZR1_9AGAR